MNMYARILDMKGISRAHKLTLLSLINFIDRTGRRDPSLLALSNATGLSICYLHTQLKKMAELGLIVIERKRNNEGRLVSHFTIILPEAEAAA